MLASEATAFARRQVELNDRMALFRSDDEDDGAEDRSPETSDRLELSRSAIVTVLWTTMDGMEMAPSSLRGILFAGDNLEVSSGRRDHWAPSLSPDR